MQLSDPGFQYSNISLFQLRVKQARQIRLQTATRHLWNLVLLDIHFYNQYGATLHVS